MKEETQNQQPEVVTTTEAEVEIETPEQARRKRNWKIAGTVLFIVVLVAIIVYTAVNDFSGENVSLTRIIEMIGSNWYYLLVLLGIFVFLILMEAGKVFIMIGKTTGSYKPGVSFNCAVLGRFYDFITPFGSGGQPFQIYYLARHGVPGGPAGAIPIGSLFLTQFSFFVCAVVSFIVGIDETIVPVHLSMQILAYVGSFFYIIVSLVLVVFSFIPKTGYKVIAWGTKVCTKLKICKKPEKWIAKGNRAIDNNKQNMAIILKSKRVLIIGTLMSFLYVIARASMPYFALLLFPDALSAAGLTPSWRLWFEVTKITFFIECMVTIIPTPGNSGAADGTFYGLFLSVLGTVAGATFTCMMVWRIFSYYMYLGLGLIVLICVKIVERRRRKETLLLNAGQQ